jgi:hypothetical protein
MSQLYDPTVDSVPLPQFVEAREAKRKAFTAFIRGSIFGAILASGAFIASAAMGGDTADFGGTGCTVALVEGQTHVAEVRCHNVHTTGQSRDEGEIEAGDFTVELRVFHGPGDVPDNFIAMPPDGYYAEPSVLSLNEWTSGVILILPFAGS